MSKILCIIDGMTDPGFRLDSYPNLSRMYLTRYTDTTQGQEPESLGCILRLLDIQKVPGHLRGYAEALGNGIAVGANDLVLRGSWLGVDADGNCSVPVPAPEQITGAGNCVYHPIGQYQSLLVFPGMASFVSDLTTHPPHACAGQPIRQLCPQGCAPVEQLFHSQLTVDRCLIPWGQSVPTGIAPFPQKAAVVCGTAIVKGIARLLGMELIPVPGVTGDVDTDLVAKTAAALNAAKEYPFVLLHINGADEASHRRNAGEKQAFLQKIDEVVIPLLLRSWHDVAVTADHGTDPKTGIHTGSLQPVFSNKTPVQRTDHSDAVPKQTAMTEAQRKIWSIQQLRKKADEVGRLPTKADFEPIDKIRIKAALGPWPRALEAAGLKEPKQKKNPNRR